MSTSGTALPALRGTYLECGCTDLAVGWMVGYSYLIGDEITETLGLSLAVHKVIRRKNGRYYKAPMVLISVLRVVSISNIWSKAIYKDDNG